MKKILLFATTLAALFLSASCQRENLEPVATGATFTVKVPGEADTRAFSDGTNIDAVLYEIYKADDDPSAVTQHPNSVNGGTPLAEGVVPMSNKEATVTFNLLQDQKYTVIFWAQVKENEDGTNSHYNTTDLRKVSLKPAATALKANLETRTAFYQVYTFDAPVTAVQEVTLVRPFAQLNLGTTEESRTPVQEGQIGAGYTIDVQKSYVKVDGLSSTFNTLKRKAEEGSEYIVDYTFDLNATPYKQDNNETLEVNGVNYHYVGMNYFFVPANEKLVTVSYEIVTDKGTMTNSDIDNVPVKANYRTNIIGNLLTTEADFEIVVDEEFADEDLDGGKYNIIDGKYYAKVESYEEFAQAIDKSDVIILDTDIVGDVTLDMEVGRHVTIDGNGHKYNGTIVLDGNSGLSTDKSLIIKNVKFETTENTHDFISSTTDAVRYARNITIEDCTFTGPGNNSDVVALRLRQAYDIVVKNCVATNLHSFGQITSSNNMTFEDLTINAGRGINFLTAAHGEVVFDNCNITAAKDDAYGIRVDAYPGDAMTVNNSTIKAYEPIVIRKAVDSYTLNINNCNLIAGGSETIIYAGTKPVINIDGKEYKSNAQIAEEALVPYATVSVPSGVYTMPAAYADGVTFEGQNNTTLVMPATVTKSVTIKDATLSSANGISFVGNDITLTLDGCQPEQEIQVKSAVPSSKKLIELFDLAKDILDQSRNNTLVLNGTTVNSKTSVISNADELIAKTSIAAGEVIILTSDIDLAGKEFAGLTAFHPENDNVFDGMGYVVSNWTNKGGSSDMGFIRGWVGPIKNVTLENVTLKTSGRSAILAAKVYSNIDNCHLVNCSIEDSYWACGGIAGLYNSGSISNCSVVGCTIKSNGGTGGIVGVINESAGERKVENCVISNSTVNNTGNYGESYSGALVCGMFNAGAATYRFTNCKYDGNTKEGNYVGNIFYSAEGETVYVDGVQQ